MSDPNVDNTREEQNIQAKNALQFLFKVGLFDKRIGNHTFFGRNLLGSPHTPSDLLGGKRDTYFNSQTLRFYGAMGSLGRSWSYEALANSPDEKKFEKMRQHYNFNAQNPEEFEKEVIKWSKKDFKQIEGYEWAKSFIPFFGKEFYEKDDHNQKIMNAKFLMANDLGSPEKVFKLTIRFMGIIIDMPEESRQYIDDLYKKCTKLYQQGLKDQEERDQKAADSEVFKNLLSGEILKETPEGEIETTKEETLPPNPSSSAMGSVEFGAGSDTGTGSVVEGVELASAGNSSSNSSSSVVDEVSFKSQGDVDPAGTGNSVDVEEEEEPDAKLMNERGDFFTIGAVPRHDVAEYMAKIIEELMKIFEFLFSKAGASFQGSELEAFLDEERESIRLGKIFDNLLEKASEKEETEENKPSKEIFKAVGKIFNKFDPAEKEQILEELNKRDKLSDKVTYLKDECGLLRNKDGSEDPSLYQNIIGKATDGSEDPALYKELKGLIGKAIDREELTDNDGNPLKKEDIDKLLAMTMHQCAKSFDPELGNQATLEKGTSNNTSVSATIAKKKDISPAPAPAPASSSITVRATPPRTPTHSGGT